MDPVENKEEIPKSDREPAKSGIEEAYEDVLEGRLTHFATAQDMYKAFGIGD